MYVELDSRWPPPRTELIRPSGTDSDDDHGIQWSPTCLLQTQDCSATSLSLPHPIPYQPTRWVMGIWTLRGGGVISYGEIWLEITVILCVMNPLILKSCLTSLKNKCLYHIISMLLLPDVLRYNGESFIVSLTLMTSPFPSTGYMPMPGVGGNLPYPTSQPPPTSSAYPPYPTPAGYPPTSTPYPVYPPAHSATPSTYPPPYTAGPTYPPYPPTTSNPGTQVSWHIFFLWT